ncbi:MAG: YihY/virulence factor BrkB family protein [Mangrovibacterium sp.]
MNFKQTYRQVKRQIQGLLIRARKVTIPGFDRIPLYDVMLLFFRSVVSTDKGNINTRASAISYSMFIAALPTLIFIITLIPYIPIANFQVELLHLIEKFIPTSIFGVVNETLTEVITKPHADLLSFSFIMGIIFATNGIVALMQAFDASSLVDETRPWYVQRWIAVRLLFILAFLLTIAIAFITGGQRAINYLVGKDLIASQLNYYLLSTGNWLIIIGLFFFAYSFLFYFAPTKKTRYRFFSAGGTMSTALSILIFGGFNFYINNFSRYNKLYGSIGTVLIIMLLFYLIAFAILFGFELNASIAKARNEGKRRLLKHRKIAKS